MRSINVGIFLTLMLGTARFGVRRESVNRKKQVIQKILDYGAG